MTTATAYLICLDKKRCKSTSTTWQATRLDEEASRVIYELQGQHCFQCGRARPLEELGPVSVG